jgi:uncharacterized membrane protein YphA (DoxX/SURF4 family)
MTEVFHQFSAVCLAFMGTLFLYSGLAKLSSLPAFRAGLGRIPYLPRSLLGGLTWTVPLGEFAIGVGLMSGMASARAAAIFVLACFAMVAALAHRHDQQIPCNCLGVDASENLSMRTVWRNACFVAIALLTLVIPPAAISLLGGMYGAVAFVLFLAIAKTVRNQFEFAHGTENSQS